MGGPAVAQPDALFTRITENLIRKRAEHNEGMVSTLEEVALHQQNIGRIEALGQLCPRLKILYLQNNLINKLQNLHKLKELQYLNLAINNITRIQNLQRCESLAKLDLTMNFIDKAGLLSIPSLVVNLHLTELILMGNPCTEWSGYRPFTIAHLPQLKKLDSVGIKPSERIAAQHQLPELTAALHADLLRQGIDPATAAQVEDDSVLDKQGNLVVAETGSVDEATGEVKRPWCAATRLLDHMEALKNSQEAEARSKAATAANRALDEQPRPKRHDDFPVIADGDRVMQRNEGRWNFSMEESDDGRSIEFEVDVGKYLDTSLIKVDVQPTYVRVLVKGKLLQLLLPCEVRPDSAIAQRSQATGRLRLEMPKQDPAAEANIALIRPKQGGADRQGPGDLVATLTTQFPGKSQQHAQQGSRAAGAQAQQRKGHGNGVGGSGFVIREMPKAQVVQVQAGSEYDCGDDDYLPPL